MTAAGDRSGSSCGWQKYGGGNAARPQTRQPRNCDVNGGRVALGAAPNAINEDNESVACPMSTIRWFIEKKVHFEGALWDCALFALYKTGSVSIPLEI